MHTDGEKVCKILENLLSNAYKFTVQGEVEVSITEVPANDGTPEMIRWEVRDNYLGLVKVTGTTTGANLIPPHETVYKHLFSIHIGFDVILERERGRRY